MRIVAYGRPYRRLAEVDLAHSPIYIVFLGDYSPHVDILRKNTLHCEQFS